MKRFTGCTRIQPRTCTLPHSLSYPIPLQPTHTLPFTPPTHIHPRTHPTPFPILPSIPPTHLSPPHRLSFQCNPMQPYPPPPAPILPVHPKPWVVQIPYITPPTAIPLPPHFLYSNLSFKPALSILAHPPHSTPPINHFSPCIEICKSFAGNW